MIVRPSDFDALQRDGVSSGTPIIGVRVRRTGLAETRFGISTSKRVGNAVVRNRARRRIREVLRASLHRMTPGWDVLVVARPPIVAADHAALTATIERLLLKRGVIARAEDA
ncbi:MAG: ribonuclease P protein component [Chloroflexota bacterium]